MLAEKTHWFYDLIGNTTLKLMVKGMPKILNYWLKHIWISREIHLEEIEVIYTLSYFFLRADQIASSGFWGRTISKYILLNFPHDSYVKKRLPEYINNGSITHTAHALKALYNISETLNYSPRLQEDAIDISLGKLRQPSGLFQPDLVTNFDEVRNLSHELRHNSTSLTCMYYLRQLSKQEERKKKYSDWTIQSLDTVIRLPRDRFWISDPQYGHSLAYMLQSFNLLSQGLDLPSDLQLKIDELLLEGIDVLKGRLEENFWLLNTHGSTKCFYTLLILEILLETKRFHEKEENLKLSFSIIENLAKLRNKDLGLSLCALGGKSNYSQSDIGVTARFLKIVYKLKSLCPEHSERLCQYQKDSFEFIRKNFLSIRKASYNSMTHSFESVLSIMDQTVNLNKQVLKQSFLNIDNIILEQQRALDYPRSLKFIDYSILQEPVFAKTLIKRDIINPPSKIWKKLGLITYWG